MNMNKFVCCALALVGALAATGCSDDDKATVTDLGARTSITLSRYYSAKGGTLALSWGSGELASIMVAGNGASTVSHAAPITPGTSTSLFMFNVKAWQGAPSTVIGFYPSTADVTCTDGIVNYEVATAQNTTVDPCLIGYTTCNVSAYEGVKLTLSQAPATLFVNVARGNYSVKSVTVTGNDGAMLAGKVSLDPATGISTASAPSVTVTLPTPVSCVTEPALVPVLLAPVSLPSGYSISITTTDGEVLSLSRTDAIDLESGKRYDTDNIVSASAKSIVICGSNKVYLVDPSITSNGDYRTGLTWEWDATDIKDALGLAKSRLNHLDDCKPVDNGKKLLVTSSYNWTALIDIETKGLLFYSTQTPGAHSAEMLPGNKIAVACSDNGNKIQLYDLGRSNEVLFETALVSAHGVVWNDATQRLYAIGGQSLDIYKLEGADTATPKLVLDRTVQTPRSGLHDLNVVDSNTLTVAGNRSYLYDIATSSFKEMTLFNAMTAIKSVNYNSETGECWYTDATVPEGTQTWSTQTIHYTKNVNGTADDMTLRVTDIDVYKVRVLHW